MSAKRATKRSSDDVSASRRQEILDLSAELFATQGFHNTSMQDIADVVQIQKASLYYYFKSKDELLWEILRSGVQAMLEASEEALAAAGDDPRDQLKELLRAHLRNLEAKRHHVVVFLTERRALDNRRLGRYIQWREEYDRVFEDVIARGQKTGVFRDGPPRMLSYGIIGMYNWMIQWYRPDGSMSLDEIGDLFDALAFSGLLRDGAAAS